ncbi:hypothetical protein BJ508DRAFT_411433 [Ascobolus immersus RN42]|uniref:2-oxoisovalerate dehydrogenase subunit alpha n=1 Tax=Ascobolus immersus RN42 TaxID=1160509 RepID=A0A3N4IJC9_ASCIM|nr:hypothetical protein BJ508DRAFT_411433 [Ascobolus immersus RN42]
MSTIRHTTRLLRGSRLRPSSFRFTQTRPLTTTPKVDLEAPTAPIRQPPNANSVHFPGALNSQFTSTMSFHAPNATPSLPTYRIMDTNGEIIDTSHTPTMDAEGMLKMYTAMVKTSIMDMIMYDSQRQGRISFYMVSSGEEGVAVGSAAALNPEDVIFSQYREQGALMYRGFRLDEFMNQMFGNRLDYGKGRNMPIHYMSERLNVHSISSPLATQIPHAVGAAYGLKREGEGRVVVCYFGEGAASEGDFHAGLNIAATRSCPVVFICRNNGYAISTPSLEQYKGDGIASRGIGYGIETIRVDGNDIWAVHEVTKRAREIASKEQRPVLIEAMTYRISHHSTSDDSFAYRPREEVESWKRRDDPITRFRKYLENKGLWDSSKEEDLRKTVKKEVMNAFMAAEKERKPRVREMFGDTFKEETPVLKKQREELKRVVAEYPNEYDLDAFEDGKDGL